MTKKLLYCRTQTSLGASAYSASPGAGNTVPLLFSNVRCSGSETMLTNCPYDSNLGLCTLTQPAAGVICHMCKPCYIVLCEMMRTHSRALNYVLLKKLCPNSPIFFHCTTTTFLSISGYSLESHSQKGLGEVVSLLNGGLRFDCVQYCLF